MSTPGLEHWGDITILIVYFLLVLAVGLWPSSDIRSSHSRRQDIFLLHFDSIFCLTNLLKRPRRTKSYFVRKMFIVVEFTDDKDIGLVPKAWKKSENWCYWPPFKNDQRITKAVKEGIQPNEDTWKLYKVRDLYSHSSYDKARKKLPVAEETSDLYTEDEMEQPRKRRKNTRFDSDDDSEDEEGQLRLHGKTSTIAMPMPPPEPTPPLPTLPVNVRRSPRRVEKRCLQPRTPPRQSHPAALHPSFNDIDECDSRSPSAVQLSQQVDMEQGSPNRPSTSSGLYHWTPRRTPQSTPRPQQAPATERNVIAPACIRSLMAAIETTTAKTEENTRLLHQILRLMTARGVPVEEEGVNQVKLPIENLEDLQEAEASLQDKAVFQRLVNSLGVIGGLSTKETVRRILCAAISTNLAKKINWIGVHGKTAFKTMRMKDVVIKSTRRNPVCSQATDAEIEEVMRLWFRYAFDRDGGKKERLLKKARETANERETHN